MIKSGLFCILLFFLLLTGCSEKEGVVLPRGPSSPRYIEPGVGPDPVQVKQNMDSYAVDEPETETSAKIVLSSEWVLLRTVNINLDFDPIEEQLIVVKTHGLPDSVIHIIIADFDTVRGDYRKTWESDTSAVNLRTFSVVFEDLVGDHNLELICFGLNAEGERTLNVFRKTQAPNGLGLYYSEICNIISDGTVEIVSLQRTQAYELKQKNGISFPIIAYMQDPGSQNVMDLVKITYYWKYQSGLYEQGKIEYIAGTKIEERQLQELFSKNVSAYEVFLEGPWIKMSGEDSGAGIGDQDIITFSVRERSITLYSSNIQELYIWESSHRTRLVNSMYINLTNEHVPFIKKQISLFLESLDTIHIRISEDDFKKSTNPWDGKYVRLKPDIIRNGTGDQEEVISPLSATDLAGFYTSDTGLDISFEFPRFTLVSEDSTRFGGYSLYTLGNIHILELVVIDETGQVQDNLTYSVDYSRQIDDTAINHILKLTPGLLGVYGFRPREDESIRFEQIEFIEQEDSQS